MNYKPLGNSDLSASVVGLGAWVLGGGQVWGRDTDDAESIRAIQKAIDLGINLIDTAPAYGFGRSEVVVGKAIKGRRDRVLIATKGGLWWEDTRGSFFTDLEGKKVYRIKRLRFAGKEPIGIQDVYIPADRCQGIADLDLENDSIYRFLAEEKLLKG